MKKKDTLDRRLGPTIREIGNRHGLSVTNLKSALAESFNDRRKGWADENVEYGEETIGGYLYDRTWPDMECQTCIDIVTAAFESAVLSDRTNENAIRKGQQQVKSEIERLYREYERKAYLDTYTQEISVEALRASMLHMEPTIAQILLDNLAACKSLDSYDIAFRKAISTFFNGWQFGTGDDLKFQSPRNAYPSLRRSRQGSWNGMRIAFNPCSPLSHISQGMASRKALFIAGRS